MPDEIHVTVVRAAQHGAEALASEAGAEARAAKASAEGAGSARHASSKGVWRRWHGRGHCLLQVTLLLLWRQARQAC